MVKSIRWSPRAASHLESICEFIAQDSEVYASIIIKQIIAIIKSIPNFPYAGRIVPEYNDKNLRERIYKNYRIIYRIKTEIIEIVAIYHGAQILDDSFSDK